MNGKTFSSGDLLEYLRRTDPRFDRTRLEGWYRNDVFSVVNKNAGGQRRFGLIDLVAARVALQTMSLSGAFITREVIRSIRGGELNDQLLVMTTQDEYDSFSLYWLPKESVKEIAALVEEETGRGNTVVVVPIASYFAQARAFIQDLENRNPGRNESELLTVK
ncbi:hypothetical protein ES705_09420 [subsurface metagenome]